VLTLAVCGYAAIVACLWLAVHFQADRAWPATLIAFGPRWLAGLPLLPLAVLVVFKTPVGVTRKLIGPLALAGLALFLGLMDFRMGLGRVSGTPTLRFMTQNLGASRVTAEGLDRLMKAERVEIAALQECPFYDLAQARFGWHFFYGGDLCLMSRYPFTVLEHDPDNAGRRLNVSLLFEIDTPIGRFQLLNIHFPTVRSGLEALRAGGFRALPQFLNNRNEAEIQSGRARDRIRGGMLPIVVAGDFNLPVESAIYRTHWGGLRNAFSDCGRGFGHTKFTSLFGIRIDHVLTSYQWACADARVVRSPYGGDHAPLIVDLVMAP